MEKYSGNKTAARYYTSITRPAKAHIRSLVETNQATKYLEMFPKSFRTKAVFQQSGRSHAWQ